MSIQLNTRAGCDALIQELFEIPPKEIVKTDIALLNLLCAHGLTGSENLNIPKCLARLDHLTAFICERIKTSTDWLRRHPNYETEAQQRMGLIVRLLKTHFGACYHPQVKTDLAIEGYVPSCDASEDFISGILNEDRNRRWGTCASFPVVVAAIARRMKYPVGLADNGKHCFARWEGKECFNIEAANGGDMAVNSDDHYRNWPSPLSEEDKQSGFFVRTLYPHEEFAMFMVKRVCYLFNFACYGEAMLWAARALQFAPDHPRFWYFAATIAWTEVLHRYKQKYRDKKLPDCEVAAPNIPVFEVLTPQDRPLFLAIEAHRMEREGNLEKAQTFFEDACRHNRWGNNEQRDLQRFLKKHGRRRKPGPLLPPAGFEKLRRFGLRVKPHQEAETLRRMADQFERAGKPLDARDALQDLYLFDPSDASVYQRFHALEQSPLGQVQMKAKYAEAQRKLQRRKQLFGKFSGAEPTKAEDLKGPLNFVNVNHIKLS